jgi:zinc transporter ZupT
MLNNFIIIIGILTFFMIEKITHSYFGESHSHSHGSHTHEKANDNKVKVSEKEEDAER